MAETPKSSGSNTLFGRQTQEAIAQRNKELKAGLEKLKKQTEGSTSQRIAKAQLESGRGSVFDELTVKQAEKFIRQTENEEKDVETALAEVYKKENAIQQESIEFYIGELQKIYYNAVNTAKDALTSNADTNFYIKQINIIDKSIENESNDILSDKQKVALRKVAAKYLQILEKQNNILAKTRQGIKKLFSSDIAGAILAGAATKSPLIALGVYAFSKREQSPSKKQTYGRKKQLEQKELELEARRAGRTSDAKKSPTPATLVPEAAPPAPPEAKPEAAPPAPPEAKDKAPTASRAERRRAWKSSWNSGDNSVIKVLNAHTTLLEKIFAVNAEQLQLQKDQIARAATAAEEASSETQDTATTFKKPTASRKGDTASRKGDTEDDENGLGLAGKAGKGLGDFIGQLGGGLMKGAAAGLKAFADPMVALGAIGFGASIAAVGAGLAGATWIMGKALPSLAEGLKSFDDIDGKHLVDVGLGIGALGAGLAVFGVGGAAAGIGGVIGNLTEGITKFFGGSGPIEKLKEFGEADINTDKVQKNAEALMAFNKAIALSGGTAISGTGNLIDSAGNFLSKKIFGGKTIIEKFQDFANLPIDPDKTSKLTRAFLEYIQVTSLNSVPFSASKATAPPSATQGTPPPAEPPPSATQGTPPPAAPPPSATKKGSVGTANPNMTTVELIKSFEKFEPRAFWDHKQYSIGYGTKANSPDEIITEPEAEKRLIEHIKPLSTKVESLNRKGNYNWNEHQKGALISFGYNLGSGALDTLTAGGTRDNKTISQKMLEYNKASGKVISGLAARRNVERQKFALNSNNLTTAPTNLTAATPSGDTQAAGRASLTPTIAAPPGQMAYSGSGTTNIQGGTTIIAGGGGGGSSASTPLAPPVDTNPTLQKHA